LRGEYEAWFADVWRSRRFTPGIIHAGNDAENPVRLCRYQDATWKFSQPHGWVVNIERSGRYEIALRRKEATGPGRIVVSWQGRALSQPVAAGENRAVFTLAAAQGTLDVVFAPDEHLPPTPANKNLEGDLDRRYLGPSATSPEPTGKKKRR